MLPSPSHRLAPPATTGAPRMSTATRREPHPGTRRRAQMSLKRTVNLRNRLGVRFDAVRPSRRPRSRRRVDARIAHVAPYTVCISQTLSPQNGRSCSSSMLAIRGIPASLGVMPQVSWRGHRSEAVASQRSPHHSPGPQGSERDGLTKSRPDVPGLAARPSADPPSRISAAAACVSPRRSMMAVIFRASSAFANAPQVLICELFTGWWRGWDSFPTNPRPSTV